MSASDYILNVLNSPNPSEFDLEVFRLFIRENQKYINSSLSIVDGKTFLYVLCEKGSAFISYIEILLNEGTNPNIIYRTKTAFDLICETGETSIFLKLLPFAVINPLEGINSPLMFACAKGHMDIIEILVENGANINHNGNFNRTPLLASIIAKQLDVVRYLCQNGAKIEHNYIFIACLVGDVNIYDILLLYGANVYTKAENGTTCLIQSIESRNKDMVERVLGANVDINERNASGFTALMIACMENSDDIISLLLDHGADVNLKTERGFKAGFFCSNAIREKYNLPK